MPEDVPTGFTISGLQGSSSAGFFTNAHDFVISHAIMVDMNHGNSSMKLLAKHTLHGVEHDSYARDPPLTCLPGTRLDIRDRIKSWMYNTAREARLAWLQGIAGVGKSAIMQTLAESEADSERSILGATLFFSRVHQRDDPQLVILTIAYQLAVKCQPYRQYVVRLLSTDPKLVEKTLLEQFRQFIVKPFGEERVLKGNHKTVLVLIDGLDECKDERAQHEIITLVGGFAQKYPQAPLVWVIASRPEQHIRAALLSRIVRDSYMEIEVPVNSDKSWLDIEQYLREEFDQLKKSYPIMFSSVGCQWPTEAQLTQLMWATSGIFVFASTAIAFIRDPAFGDPISQLNRVLDVVSSRTPFERRDDSFANLDALYSEIMSSVPQDLLSTVRDMLSIELYPEPFLPPFSFSDVCNFLGVTQEVAQRATSTLSAVLVVPEPGDTQERLHGLHKSFIDFLSEPSRSGPFCVTKLEAKAACTRCSIRILKEAHDTVNNSVKISLVKPSWPVPGQGHIFRARLFIQSLVLLLHHIKASNTIWSLFDNASSFFEDLDLEAVFGPAILDTSLAVDVIRRELPLLLFDIIQRTPTLSHLEGRSHQILPISALNLCHIDANRMRLAVSQERINPLEVFTNPAMPDLSGKFQMDPRKVRWDIYMNKLIGGIMAAAPELPVILHGRGDRRYILVQFQYQFRLRVLYGPYRQS